MNVNEQKLFHAEKFPPKYSSDGNQSTAMKNNSGFENRIPGFWKAFRSLEKVIFMAFIFLFSFHSLQAQEDLPPPPEISGGAQSYIQMQEYLELNPDWSPTKMPNPINYEEMTTTGLLNDWDAIGFGGNGTFFAPPDPIGAAGQNHVVNVVNVSIEWYTKGGVQQNSQTLQSFFGSPTSTFDPKVIYDQYEDRFVVVTLEFQGRNTGNAADDVSNIYVAVSKTGDPNAGWWFTTINSLAVIGGINHWADYPGFAVDEEAVYITNNMFGFEGVTNFGVRLWIIDKGGVGGFYDGSPAGVTIHDPYAGGGNASTTQPAHTFGAPPAGVGTYLLSQDGGNFLGIERVQYIRVDNPLGAVTFTQGFAYIGNITNSFNFPDAPQLGGGIVQTNDRRALNAVWRNGLIATCFTVEGTGVDAGQATAHWVLLNDNGGGAPTLNDNGSISGEDIAPGTFTFFPSVALNMNNDLAIGFSASAPSIYPGAYYTAHEVTDPPGTVQPSGTLRSGTANYNIFSTRWGDYSGTVVDPADDLCFWIFNEYATTNAQGSSIWRTAIGNFCVQPPVSLTCPSQENLLGCSEDDINFGGTLGTFSSLPKSITEAEFIALNGSITPGTPPYNITYEDVLSAGPCPMTIVTRTFKVTDAVGTMDECQQLITVQDLVQPTFDCPQDMHVQLESGECEKQFFWQVPDADDECTDDPTITQIFGPASGSILDIDLSPYTITYKAEDDCGNMQTCSFEIYLHEFDTDGIIACEDQINVEFDESCEYYATPGDMLKGDHYSCFDDYEIIIMLDENDTDPIPGSPLITGEYAGMTLVAKVCDTNDPNYPDSGCCWGYILVEDKTPPELCCEDFMMDCNADIDPDNITGGTKVYESGDVEKLIPDADGDTPGAAELTIDIECEYLEVADVNVYLEITHPNIDELSAVIVHPDGITDVALFNTSAFHCGFGNAAITFDDWALDSYADFDAACNSAAPGKAGQFRPFGDLNDFNSLDAAGQWKIIVRDHVDNNVTGSVQVASIELEANFGKPIGYDACDGEIEAVLDDEDISDVDCDADCYQTITRIWLVTDDSGNKKYCEQVICLKRPTLDDIVCPPDYDGLCTDDPLESKWLQDLLVDCEDSGCGAEVRTCTYLGEDVIEVSLNPDCSDPYYSVYECDGTNVFDYGGIFAINLDKAADLQSCSVIFECGDPLPPPTNAPMLTCDGTFDKDINGYPDPSHTGQPSYKGNPIGGVCMFNLSDHNGLPYSDQVFPTNCDGSITIKRTWMVFDMCTSQMKVCEQIIKVVDNEPPDIQCPPDRIETAGSGCNTSVTLLPPTVLEDNCSTVEYTVDHDEGNLIMDNGDYKLTGLPLGEHIITYIAEDACGNTADCTYKITVVDETGPPCVYSSVQEIDISGTGNDIPWNHFIDEDILDNLDNCSNPVTVEVRRLDMDFCPGNDETQFDDHIPFSCCDVGHEVMIQIRLTDAIGNAVICDDEILIGDMDSPGITCPDDKEIDCDDYLTELATYDGVSQNPPGIETYFVADDLTETFVGYYSSSLISDNCGTTVYITDGFLDVDDCGNSVDAGGQLAAFIRTYTVEDESGNTDFCEQKITIKNLTPFDPNTDIAPFPSEVTIACDQIGTVGGPDLSPYQGCDKDQLSVGLESETVDDPSGNDHCFRLLREWRVYSDCPVPNTLVTTLNQTIKVTDNVKPTIDECSVVADMVIEGENLEFSFEASDACTDLYSPPLPEIEYRYTIDQGNDGGQPEIDVVGELGTELTGGGTSFPVGEHLVTFFATDYCGNEESCSLVVTVTAAFSCNDVKAGPFEVNVGASAGATLLLATDPSLYDITPTPDFKLSFDGVNPGDPSLSFDCSDIVANAPTLKTIFIHLPDGTTCERAVNIVDKTSPAINCTIGTIVLPSPGPNQTLNFADHQDAFITIIGDNCTSFGNLTVTFDPLTLDCGNMPIEDFMVSVTVKDEFNHGIPAIDGNPITCNFLVDVDCSSPPFFNVSGAVENEEGAEVEYVDIEVEGDNMQDVSTTGNDGTFSFNLESNSNYSITPERDDNILNGVSTYDLVLMSKHILQLELLSSPYKIIAADVNHSGAVSTIDMVALRRVILFIDDEFPNNTSWRFVDAEFVFPDPENPFDSPFPEIFTINGLTEDEVADFVGVKIGDLNCSAAPNDLTGSSDDRDADGDLVLSVQDQQLKAGETYQIDFQAKDFDQVAGFQFTMSFDEDILEFNEVSAGGLTNINDGNFGLHKLEEGVITASWNANGDAPTLENTEILFSLSFTALEDGQLSDLININSRLTRAEAYDELGLLDLSLEFIGESGVVAADHFELYQNMPNPFKDETVIGFNMPKSGKAIFKVFDISGRVIRLIEDEYSKGYNEISINRSDLHSNGVLYYQLETAEHIAAKKMVLID